jgi:hypothetical protein
VEKAGEYAGSFTDGSGRSLEFKASGERLLLQHDGGDIVLETMGRGTFYTPHPDFDRYPLGFGRDEDGTVVEVVHGTSWYTNDRYSGATEFDTPADWAAYTGRYRSHSPWFSYFEVGVVKGRLVVITGEGGESSAGSTVLVPEGDGTFRVGVEPTPEVLAFRDVVDGHALRAEWSGHQFHRVLW